MPGLCVTGGCTKEGNFCKECRKLLPPPVRRGGRRREYCSPECRKKKKARDQGYDTKAGMACRNCGKPAPQSSGRGRCKRYCSDDCRRRKQSAAACAKSFICQNCQRQFVGPAGRMFCSPRCRYKTLISDPVACKSCGVAFVRKRHGQRHCSSECADQSRRDGAAKAAGLARLRAVTLQCLCCSSPFRKKSSGRSVGKYCSRECAFEARRLRLPCAALTRRCGVELYGQLAVWFHAWGEVDHLDPKNIGHRRGGHKYRCRLYGCHYEPFSTRSILARDNWTCQICRCSLLAEFTRLPDGKVAPNSPTLDHIVPLSSGPAGPGHRPSNAQAACWRCNAKKGSRTPDSFALQ